MLIQAQQLATIGVLSGGIAHDFNNSLQLIMSSLDILSDQVKDDQQSREIMRKITLGTKRAAELSKQMLGLSRQTKQSMCDVDMHQIVGEVIKLAQSALPSTVDIIDQSHQVCRPVCADPTRIYQVAMTLILFPVMSMRN